MHSGLVRSHRPPGPAHGCQTVKLLYLPLSQYICSSGSWSFCVPTLAYVNGTCLSQVQCLPPLLSPSALPWLPTPTVPTPCPPCLPHPWALGTALPRLLSSHLFSEGIRQLRACSPHELPCLYYVRMLLQFLTKPTHLCFLCIYTHMCEISMVTGLLFFFF